MGEPERNRKRVASQSVTSALGVQEDLRPRGLRVRVSGHRLLEERIERAVWANAHDAGPPDAGGSRRVGGEPVPVEGVPELLRGSDHRRAPGLRLPKGRDEIVDVPDLEEIVPGDADDSDLPRVHGDPEPAPARREISELSVSFRADVVHLDRRDPGDGAAVNKLWWSSGK